jgi:hypothetical protein
MDEVNALVEQARAAQALADGYDQARADELVAAAGWAIMEPARNRRWPSWRWPTAASATSRTRCARTTARRSGLLRDLQGAKLGRRDRRGPGARPGRDRAAGGRGVRGDAVDQPGGDAGQQDHQRAQGPQRRGRGAFAQGLEHGDAADRPCSSSSSTASARRATWCRCCRRR